MNKRLLFGLVLTVGCGGGGLSEPNTPNDAATTDSGTIDSSVLDSGSTDSGGDSTAADSGAGDSGAADSGAADSGGATDSSGDAGALPSCFGESQPLQLSGRLPFADVKIGAATGAFNIDYATTRSTIDLAAFSSPPTASGCDSTKLGQSCSFSGFDFFGSWGTVTLITADHSWLTGPVREAGILGTDFLSVQVFTLDYTGKRIYRSLKASFCTESALGAAGFVALPTNGYFATSLSSLKPLSDVVAGAASGLKVPNVPTVPLTVAGAGAVAQLDTGFDDGLVPYSINVNAAFYDAIVAKSSTALVRAASKDLLLTTCVSGVSEPVEAYTLASGVAAEFPALGGTIARRYPGATIFVKRTPTAAKSCGGIGTWTAPAAQVAGSFFVDMGVLAFDPYGFRVWVRPKS